MFAPMASPAAKLAASIAFMERFRADREAGQALDLAGYCAAFPGFEDVVTAEWARLTEDGETGADIGARQERTAGDADTEAPPGDLSGTVLAAYRIERELGRGGQGAVYLARDLRLGRKVALKTLPGAWGLDPGALRRFVQEGRALAALDHPGICAVYEAATHEGVPFMAMRYVEGETFAARLARRSGRPERAEIESCVRIVEDAARAVHAANEAGFVHRDLKPANVMVQPDGKPVILDFGLARSDDDARELTRTGDLIGTPAYMAPEQASGEVSRIDRRTDVYALGVILYQAVTGVRPFEAPTAGAVLDLVRGGGATPPREVHRTVDRDLDVVVRTAIARDAVDRYATALDLAEELRRFLAGEPVRARPIPWYGRLARWARRKPVTAALVAVIAVLVPIAGGLAGKYLADRPAVRAQAEAVRRAKAERMLEVGFTYLRNEIAATDPRALEKFRAALALRPDSTEAFAGLVRAQLRARRYEEAARSLDEYERVRGVSPFTQRLRAELLRRTERFEDAVALEATLPPPLTAAECFLEGLRWQAMAGGMRTRGDEDEISVEWFEKAMLRSPVFRRLFLNALAVAVGRTKLEPIARRTAETARTMVGGAEGELLAGLALVRSDPDAAANALREVVRLDPSRSVDYALSTVLASLGRFAEAAAAQREVVRTRPDDATAYHNLSFLLFRAGDLPEAEAAARAAVRLRPDLADMHMQLAIVRGAAGARDDELAGIFAAGATAEPSNAVVRGHYAATLNAIGRKEEALQEARQAAALLPREPLVNRALGRILGASDPAAARDCFLRAAEAAPEDSSTWAMAAVASAMLGDGPAALRYGERAEEARRAGKGAPLDARLAPQLEQIRLRFGKPESRPADADPLDVP
jgi:serine/threonine-protein kinase